VQRRVLVGRNPWRWALAAVGLLFVSLELPAFFSPLPDYAQQDGFEFFMFYAVPAVIVGAGLGFFYVALRSGVFVDAQGVLIRPPAGMRSKRMPLASIRAVTLASSLSAVVWSVSPALIDIDGNLVDLGLARYETPAGQRRAERQARRISSLLDRPFTTD